MYSIATLGARATSLAGIVLAISGIQAQTAPAWRHVGNALVDESLAGLATGPVARVWYGTDASRLLIQTLAGQIYQTDPGADIEIWEKAGGNPPLVSEAIPVRLPEDGARVRAAKSQTSRLYAFATFVYRSDDGGASWQNLTAFRGASVIGDDLNDLAVSPANPDEVAIAGAAGVFRSVDGGRSWSGLNQGLPNLPAARLMSLPADDRGVRLALDGNQVVEWRPGEKQSWLPVENFDLLNETQLRQALSTTRGGEVTALTISGDLVYAGMSDGRIAVSSDRGRTWQVFALPAAGPVERFWVNPKDPRVALAAMGARAGGLNVAATPTHVVHTTTGGAFWDDFTGNLPDSAAHGVAADLATGAVYVATDQGVYLAYADLGSLGAIGPWTPLSGLPQAPAMDVQLDAQGNQLWTALGGFGVYSTLAPHRLRDPSVVSSADFVARAAAPGSLVSVLGLRVQSAHAGDLSVPVLAATNTESQIQIPFEARGTSLSLTVDAAGGSRSLPLVSLGAVSPAIFADPDGTPMLLDSENGVMLDVSHPAHSGAHIQILAAGLGRVSPDWPTGLAAPLENPPQVAAPVRVYLDRTPVVVSQAVLAPGYVGFYLVDIEIPKIVNYGPAELYLEMNGQTSNRVRVYIEP